jgi:2-dehydropantoate 2-reductase
LFNSQLVAPLTAHITTHAEVLLPEPMLFKGSFIRAKTGSEALHWGKLLINLGNAIGAVYQATFKDLLTLPPLRTALADTLEEATQVLDAAGIVWELPLAVPARVYVWALRHGGPLPWWVAQAKNGLGEGAYPSMVADVRAGRPTEVAWLNGEIVRLAAALGRDAPVNRGWVERLTALNPATAAR